MLNRLNIVHVAGTKGKGATCAFTSYFLTAYGGRTGWPKKVGLYTSPHLRNVQERIRINSKPLSEDSFTKYIFEVWNGLEHGDGPEPRYLQLLLLTALHAFIKEEVDVAIIETHNGGEYDATNVITRPTTTGITTIGMDHVEQLGPTIERIAWHKSGIFKPGAPAFFVAQKPEVTTVMQQRAEQKDVHLHIVGDDPALPSDAAAVKPAVQRVNASLGLALASTVLKKLKDDYLTADDIEHGLRNFVWDGRFQKICQGKNRWYLDGAHNELSVRQAALWYADEIEASSLEPRVVIFSHISDRDGAAILKVLAQTLAETKTPTQHLILSTYDEKTAGSNELGVFHIPQAPCKLTDDLHTRPLPQAT